MITYNVELEFNSDSQRVCWLNLLQKEREVYNFVSKRIIEENLILSRKVIHDNCYFDVRKLFPDLPSQIVENSELAALATARTLKSLNKKGLQKNQDIPYKKNLSLRLTDHLYSQFTKKSVRLSSGEKNKRLPVMLKLYPKIEYLFDNYQYHDPLIFVKDSRFFLSVSFDVPEYAVTEGNETVLGVDLGLRRIASTSDGNLIKAPDYLKQRRKLRYLKRCLRSKADRGSKSAKKHLKKLQHKEQNLSKNFCHLVANKLLETDKSILVLEDLTKIKQDTSKTENGYKRTSHNNRMSQIPFYQIKTILSYKAPLYHKRVETVNPAYTSQEDSRGLKNGIRRGCRYYAIDGVILDADVNAACNIARRYCKRLSSFLPAIDGSYKLRKQAVINQPIVVLSYDKPFASAKGG